MSVNIVPHCEYFDNILQIDIDGEKMSLDYKENGNAERNKVMLMMHGYNDYHYTPEVYNALEEKGFHVVALTLRNYGQNITDTARQFYPPVTTTSGSLSVYFQEIEESIKFIDGKYKKYNKDGKDGKDVPIYVTAHSTGGLIISFYLLEKPERQKRFTKLILNAPIFDLDDSWLLEIMQETLARPASSLMNALSYFNPLSYIRYTKLNTPVSPKTIRDANNKVIKYEMPTGKHYDIIIKNGFNLNPADRCQPDKPWVLFSSPQYFAISSAITTAYKKIQSRRSKGKITVPTLVLYATNDTLLDPKEIVKYSEHVCAKLTKFGRSGYHNVFASNKEERTEFVRNYINYLNDPNYLNTRDIEVAVTTDTTSSSSSFSSMCSGSFCK